MGRLTDILNRTQHSKLAAVWEKTEAAMEFAPLPPGDYVVELTKLECDVNQNDTLGCKLTFRVVEGKYAGRLLRHTLWLTEDALPYTKRDLEKIGIRELEQLDNPFDKHVTAKLRVVVRKLDDGTEFNHVQRFQVLSVDDVRPDAFAPNLSHGIGETDGTDIRDRGDGEF